MVQEKGGVGAGAGELWGNRTRKDPVEELHAGGTLQKAFYAEGVVGEGERGGGGGSGRTKDEGVGNSTREGWCMCRR